MSKHDIDLSYEAYQRRMDYQEAGREKARNFTPLHLMGCMLYWGEGTKSPRSMELVNTDRHMLRLFIRFLREELNIQDEIIKLKVQAHTNDEEEIEKIKQFWLDWLELAPTCKIYYTEKKSNSDYRKNRYEYGMCTICVYRVAVVQQIFGAIQEYIGFENSKWVEYA